MVIVDAREAESKYNRDLVPLLTRIGLKVQVDMLPYGDVAFEGNTAHGRGLIGIERKRLSDMLNCIDDARYNSQRIGMKEIYAKSILLLEAVWSVGGPPFQEGILIAEARPGSGSWGPFMQTSRRVMYSKLYRYLLSVAMSGVIITYCRDLVHTAYSIAECFHYFQKPWANHTSLLQTQELAIPQMNGHPSLTREWAARIDGIGVKLSQDAEALFKTPYDLATADETDWMQIPGLSVRTAKQVVRQIRGLK